MLLAALAFSTAATAVAPEPRVLQAEPPRYPEVARAARSQGTVRVEVAVGPDGRVTRTTVLDWHPLLGMAAEEAAARFRFHPAPETPGPRSIILSFTFRIEVDDSVGMRTEALFAPPAATEVSYIEGRTLPLAFGYPDRCPVHGLPLESDVVPARCETYGCGWPSQSGGLPLVVNGETLLLLRPEDTFEWESVEQRLARRYRKACLKKFPLALPAIWAQCWTNMETRAEVRYCPECRNAEERWARKHPKVHRVAPRFPGT